jgi:hypothetical protein
METLRLDQFIEIEGILLNKWNIQKCVEVEDDIESIYYSQKKCFRDRMEKRYI